MLVMVVKEQLTAFAIFPSLPRYYVGQSCLAHWSHEVRVGCMAREGRCAREFSPTGRAGHLQPKPWHTCPPLSTFRLDLQDIPNSVRLVAPDFGILLVSAICLGICSRLKPTSNLAGWSPEAEPSQSQDQVRRTPCAPNVQALCSLLRPGLLVCSLVTFAQLCPAMKGCNFQSDPKSSGAVFCKSGGGRAVTSLFPAGVTSCLC